jgi:hypothetical protein
MNLDLMTSYRLFQSLNHLANPFVETTFAVLSGERVNNMVQIHLNVVELLKPVLIVTMVVTSLGSDYNCSSQLLH